MIEVEVTVKNRLRGAGEKVLAELDKAVRRAAFRVEAEAKRRAPVDTGALRASIYVATGRSQSDYRYTEAIRQARRLNPSIMLFAPRKPEEALEAVVAVGAEYAVHLEYGTRFSVAHPFMRPALASIRPVFERECNAALRRGLEK